MSTQGSEEQSDKKSDACHIARWAWRALAYLRCSVMQDQVWGSFLRKSCFTDVVLGTCIHQVARGQTSGAHLSSDRRLAVA